MAVNSQTASRWDLCRFVRILAYFGVIPFFSNIGWFQQWLGSRANPKVDRSAVAYGMPKAGANGNGFVLVVGATGGVGKRVVRRLLARGYRVRSLVRDAVRARTILGDGSELIEADITIPETLTEAVTDNLRAVICCTGSRVQPVEGDTPTREKYYQGVKFYRSEVADTPEVVEYQGVQNLVRAVTKGLVRDDKKIVFDFTQPNVEMKETWGALDDVVMGGVSESEIRLYDSSALFSGTVSTANSGGFVSVRTRNIEPALDFSTYDGVELRLRGDGKRYKFLLRTQTNWDSLAYSASFDTVANAWIDVRLPFSDFVPVFRARTVKTADPLDTHRICAFQLMLSKFEYDGALNPQFQPGAFQLQIESIQVYRNRPLPQFILNSSAAVTRPGRPGVNIEEEIPIVRLNEQLGGILTWKLRGEDCLRQSGIHYTIIRPCALTEEAGGQGLQFDQGDRLTGKISREDMAELCVQALEQPDACNVTFEVATGQGNSDPDQWSGLFSQLKPD